jgi:hypothetical protein
MTLSIRPEPVPGAGDSRDLRRVIRGVRRRWRFKVALKGCAITLGFSLVALLVSAYGMDHFRYTAWAISTFRIFAWAAVIALALRFLVLPLVVRVPDRRVALYIEEHDSSLQAALISAVQVDAETPGSERPDLSPELARRLVEQALQRCQEIDYGRLVEGRSLQRFSGLLSGVAIAGMIAALVSPAFVRQAVPFLLAPWSFGASDNPYSVVIEPGHATLAKGADQVISAHLVGFDSDDVELVVQSGAGGDWERWPMTSDSSEDRAAFLFMLLDVTARTEYFVEASGVRSELYRLDVVEVPYVERIDLEYEFPSYSGLTTRLVEDGGDVAALYGTRVSVHVTPTVAVPVGQLVIDGEEPLALEPGEAGDLVATFEVSRESFYRIELPMRDGAFAPSSPEYRIDVLEDQPPIIRFLTPGRDARATTIEEVFTEVEAEDDYGVTRLELVYTINGARDETVVLHQGGRAAGRVSAGHTFFLEEYQLEPGDFISYYARARDNRDVVGTARPRQATSTDIYFLEIRPFGVAYRQAEQGGAPGGAGSEGTLSSQQRQVVAATFKLQRDRNEIDRAQFDQDVATVALLQGRLRNQVENLSRRMQNRGALSPGSDLVSTSESLQQAVVEMLAAEKQLEQRRVGDALPPEQRALQHLQRAEAAFRDVQVAFGGGAGGAGEGGMNAEDLADLFELELDKLQNQYETVQRGQRDELDDEIDEAMQRLQELARRQEQEAERQRSRAARAPNQQGGAGGGQQRQLAEQAEELGRRLERLAREHASPAMQDTARRLREAADAMRRADAGGQGQGLEQGLSALERLKEARRLLDKNRAGRVERDMAEAQQMAEALERAQQWIAADVKELGREPSGEIGPAANGDRLSQIDERKDSLAQQVEALEEQLDQMARDSRHANRDAARELQGAAGSIRDSKLKEKIRYSKGVVRARAGESADQFEHAISSDVEQLSRRVARAAKALREHEGDPRAEALERTRDLVRRVESIEERVRDASSEEARGGTNAERSSSEPAPGTGRAQGPVGKRNAGPGGAGFSPGSRAASEMRQMQREFRQRAEDANAIGRQLSAAGGVPAELRAIERQLRELENAQVWGDPRGLEELAAQTLEDLKLFEYALRRELEGSDDAKRRLSGSDDVPEGWRQLVEEYYRTLSQDSP